VIDFSRFYLTGGPIIGYALMCLDCDVDDVVRWDNPTGLLGLGEMVRVAEAHVAARHPEKEPARIEGGEDL
jgi:hypothetical protein